MDNQAEFVEAFGSAFDTWAPGLVSPKELHSVAHDRDGGVLEDTLILGDTALVNRTVIGVPCEIVGPDGAAMTVTSRWDGDVWVEVDDGLLLETRRWLEGEHMVVARTIAKPNGTLVTSKAFFGKPRRRVPAFVPPASAPAPDALAGGGKKGKKGKGKGKKADKKGEKKTGKRAAAPDAGGVNSDDDDDAKSDAGSVYSQVASAVGGFGFGGLFGAGGKPEAEDGGGEKRRKNGENNVKSAKGAADAVKAANFFGLDPDASPLCGSFACNLRGTSGHIYVFDFAVGFGANSLGDQNKWSTPASLVNNLEVSGPTSLIIGLSSGLTLTFEQLTERDALYDCMVGMLERLPPSPGEDIHGDAEGRIAVPLRVGFEPERFVIVHIIQAGFLPEEAAGSTPIATAALGRYGAAVPAAAAATMGAPSHFGRTLVFPAAEVDLGADTVALGVAAGGLGDSGAGASTLGEAQLPLAVLPRTRAGAKEAKDSPFTVGLIPPGRGSHAPPTPAVSERGYKLERGDRPSEEDGSSGPGLKKRSQALAYQPSESRGGGGVIGELSIAAWIGTAAEVKALGSAATLAEPSQAADAGITAPAVVRVPPAVARVTVNVHAVRGVRVRSPGRGKKEGGGSEDGDSNDDESESEDDDAAEEGAEPVDLTCKLSLGDQSHVTAPALHAPKAQATWGAPESPFTFTVAEPRGGALTVDLMGPHGAIGRVNVDMSSLRLRPKKGAPRRHWVRLLAPPEPDEEVKAPSNKAKSTGGNSKTGGAFGGFPTFGFGGGAASSARKTSTARASDSDSDEDSESDEDSDAEEEDVGDDEYLGEILLDGFVDEGCGPTAAIGRKAPLGELSLEILSLRAITPEGRKSGRSQPAVMMRIGGSWAMLPAAAGGAPPAWRREVIAAVHDPADCAEIGIFDVSDGDAPLGFVTIPVRRLPRGYPMVSTLALSGGVNTNPQAEITVRVRYKPLVSTGALLCQYFTPPLPRSVYIFGSSVAAAPAAGNGEDAALSGVEQLVVQQHEYCEDSLLRGTAPLPAAMVGAMLPPPPGARKPRGASKGSVKGVKACMVRIAAALDAFGPQLRAMSGALTWEKPINAGLLHVGIMAAAFHSWTVFPGLFVFLAMHTAYAVKPGRWSLLGADKSGSSGSYDVGRAPPGSKLLGAEVAAGLGANGQPVFNEGGAGKGTGKPMYSASRALGVAPSAETYEGCVQAGYWVQMMLKHAVWAFEGLHDLMTWKDAGKSNAFMIGCFVAAWVTLFISFQTFLVCLSFVALRHPIVGKPPTLPYRIGLASED